MSTDLVVCAYKNDLRWVGGLREKGARVLVYDKWDGPGGREDVYRRLGPENAGVEVSHLPDVGKCDHAWAHHIVERYDRLADWTVFSTDRPHAGLGGADLEGCLEPGECLRVPWLWRGRDWGPDGRLNWKLWGSLPDRNGTNWKERYESGKVQPAALPFVAWVREFVGFDPDGPDWPGYQPGGLLAVPRKAITYLPRSFYERLREQVSHSVEPEEGHYLERSWTTIFCGLAKYREAECVRG